MFTKMKIPKVFVPEKDLEKKVHELTKKPKSQNPKKSGYSKLDCRVIYNRAKEIAENIGKLDLAFCVYNFEDEKISIEYATNWGRGKTHLRIDIKENGSFPTVFEAVQYEKSKKQTILAYAPGKWQDHLKEVDKNIIEHML